MTTTRRYHRVGSEQAIDDVLTVQSSSPTTTTTSRGPIRLYRQHLDLPDDDEENHQFKNDPTVVVSLPDETTNNRRRAVIIFSLCSILAFADQHLMAPNLTAIGKEFGMDDEERDRKLGGDISLAFFLLGAPASFVVGCLADQTDRSTLFALTAGIGACACIATYFAETYAKLYIFRAVTGFSLGGAIPLIYSILGDLFRAEDRHPVTAIVSLGLGLGESFGRTLSGFLGPTFGWRIPFLVVGVPALICAILAFLFVKDPKRGGMEEIVLREGIEEMHDQDNHHDTYEAPVQLSSQPTELRMTSSSPSMIHTPSGGMLHPPGTDNIKLTLQDEQLVDGVDTSAMSCSSQNWRHPVESLMRLLSTPSVLLLMIQGTPGCVPWGILNTYFVDFLSQERGFSVEVATTIMMFDGLGILFGLLVVGGAGGRYLYQIDNRYPAIIAGGAAIMGCFPFWILLNYVDSKTPYWKIAPVAFIMGIFAGPTGPIIKTTLTNVTLPRTRGQAFALHALFDDLGKGLGPFFTSILIARLGGRLRAFNIGVLGWTVCGFINLAVFCTVKKDEAVVQSTLAAEMKLMSSSSSSSIKDTAALMRHQEDDGVELSCTQQQQIT